MAVAFNYTLGINEDAKWQDIVKAYDAKMEGITEKISTHNTNGVSPNLDPVVKQYISDLTQLTTELKKILTQRIDNAILLLEKKINSLQIDIQKTSDAFIVANKTDKRGKLDVFKRSLKRTKENLNSQNEKKQIDYGQACREIHIAAINAKLELADHTCGFYQFINWILDSIGITAFKIKTDTEDQIDSAEKTVYQTIRETG